VRFIAARVRIKEIKEMIRKKNKVKLRINYSTMSSNVNTGQQRHNTNQKSKQNTRKSYPPTCETKRGAIVPLPVASSLPSAARPSAELCMVSCCSATSAWYMRQSTAFSARLCDDSLNSCVMINNSAKGIHHQTPNRIRLKFI